jgi:hypothetical protein
LDAASSGEEKEQKKDELVDAAVNLAITRAKEEVRHALEEGRKPKKETLWARIKRWFTSIVNTIRRKFGSLFRDLNYIICSLLSVLDRLSALFIEALTF